MIIRFFVLISFCAILIACREEDCSVINYHFKLSGGLPEDVLFLKLYPGEDAFGAGQDGLVFNGEDEAAFIAAGEFGGGIGRLDVRMVNGLNSWASQHDIYLNTETEFTYDQCQAFVRLPGGANLNSYIKGSPTYLHLALDSLMQEGGSKTWAIDRIYNEDQIDVTGLSEWTCLRNLTFTFFKGGKGAKVMISTADTTCVGFEDLFDGRINAYASYSLEGVDQNRLEITYPSIHDDMRIPLTFTVLESDFGQIGIQVTNQERSIGYTSLTPLRE